MNTGKQSKKQEARSKKAVRIVLMLSSLAYSSVLQIEAVCSSEALVDFH
jgi:hypothetical protein